MRPTSDGQRKQIAEYFDIDDNVADGIRAAMKLGEDGNRQASDAMKAINGLLDGHGVEAIRGDYYVDRYHGEVVATYVNMGDTYVGTVLYETETGQFMLTDLGGWVESKGEEYGVY
jgi:hypothetical protein